MSRWITAILPLAATLYVAGPAAGADHHASKFGCTISVTEPTYGYGNIDTDGGKRRGPKPKVNIHTTTSLHCKHATAVRFLVASLFRVRDLGEDPSINVHGGYKKKFTAKAGKTYHVTATRPCPMNQDRVIAQGTFNIPGAHIAKSVRSRIRYPYCDRPFIEGPRGGGGEG
jgi:hypothetical protein